MDGPSPFRPSNSYRETYTTLFWAPVWGHHVNFGGWTGDYFFEYFIPETDGYISSIDLEMSDFPDIPGGSLAVALYRMQYGWDEIDTDLIADECGLAQLGYYLEDGEIGISGGEWVQGGVHAYETAHPDSNYDPLLWQVWPDSGRYIIPLEPNDDDVGTVSVPEAFFEDSCGYAFTRDDPIVMLVEMRGFPDNADSDSTRMGFYANTMGWDPQPSLKFYGTTSSPNGRCDEGDHGWYIRYYVWDWKVHVWYTGDVPPEISDVTRLRTTLDTGPQTVHATITDVNYSGGPAGIEHAEILYSVNSGEYVSVVMSANGDEYTGEIPGQLPGSNIRYDIRAIDVAGNSITYSESPYSWEEMEYDIYQTTSPFLFLYEASSNFLPAEIADSLHYRYNAPSDEASWDIWDGRNYNQVSMELLSRYRMIYYVTGFYPENIPDGALLLEWMQQADAEHPRYLFLTGQDYGVISAFADTTFPAGSFEYDFLGLDRLGAQDIEGGTTDLYAIDAVPGDPLSGYLTDLEGALAYDPSQLQGTNWIDHMEVRDETEAWLLNPNDNGSPLAVRFSGDHWKTVYSQVDPYCMVYGSDSSGVVNITDSVLNIWNNIFEWFDPDFVSIGDENIHPLVVRLAKPYPNPFNPVTTIQYELPAEALVSLTIFDILGRPVNTLVDSPQSAGYYSVAWNATDDSGSLVSAGVYFCRLQVATRIETMKIILIK